MSGRVQDLSISSDEYHGEDHAAELARNAQRAAEELGITTDILRVAQPEAMREGPEGPQAPPGEVPLRYRGRAAAQLAARGPRVSWERFTLCPGEELREPERVHVDPEGNVHLCQGILVGNVTQESLARICASYDPGSHPVVAPLLDGGPAELVRRYGLPHDETYADACHLCDHARRALRPRYPGVLGPDAVYRELETS
jgi:hypothetical protein